MARPPMAQGRHGSSKQTCQYWWIVKRVWPIPYLSFPLPLSCPYPFPSLSLSCPHPPFPIPSLSYPPSPSPLHTFMINDVTYVVRVRARKIVYAHRQWHCGVVYVMWLDQFSDFCVECTIQMSNFARHLPRRILSLGECWHLKRVFYCYFFESLIDSRRFYASNS